MRKRLNTSLAILLTLALLLTGCASMSTRTLDWLGDAFDAGADAIDGGDGAAVIVPEQLPDDPLPDQSAATEDGKRRSNVIVGEWGR